MIDRTFVAEEQSILNRLREQEAKVNGKVNILMYTFLLLLLFIIIIFFLYLFYRRVQKRREAISAKG